MKTDVRIILRSFWVIVFVGFLALGVFGWIVRSNAAQAARKLALAQYAGCLRGNVLRNEVNHDNAAFKLFIGDSAVYYRSLGGPVNIKRSRQYAKLAADFHLVAVPNCLLVTPPR